MALAVPKRSTCYFYNTCAIRLAYGRHACRPHPPRATDHGHPLPARPGDGRRGDERLAGEPDLLHGAHAVARARRKRPGAPRGTRTPLRLQPGCSRATRRGSRRCAIWSTRSSTAPPRRSVGALLGGEGARSPTRNWRASRTWSRRRRKRASDEPVLRNHREGVGDPRGRAGRDRAASAAIGGACGIGCSPSALRARR